MISRLSRIWHHDFTHAPIERWALDEPDPIAHLRGIVTTLDGLSDSEIHRRFRKSEYYAMCRAHLDELGLTLDEAKRLVLPIQPKPRDVHARAVPAIRARRTRNGRQPRAHASADRAAADESETPPGEDDPVLPQVIGDWSALPPVLRVAHLVAIFSVIASTARRHLVAGDYGRRFKLGRSWHIRTEDLRAHLAELAERQSTPAVSRDAAVRRWQRVLAQQQRRNRKRGKGK